MSEHVCESHCTYLEGSAPFARGDPYAGSVERAIRHVAIITTEARRTFSARAKWETQENLTCIHWTAGPGCSTLVG